MYKVLIADTSEVFCQSLAEKLPEEFEAYLLQDGEKLAEYLLTVRPDILVLDLSMTATDCLYVLETAAHAGIRPSVLALSNYISSYLNRLLDKLQVSYFLRKPCDMHHLASRIVDIAEDAKLQLHPIHLIPTSERVESFLRYLGFFPYLKGYKMLVSGICIMMDKPYVSLTKELYPQVGEIWGTDWKQVEHAMRNCIASAYKNRNDWVWRMYFPCDPDKKVGHLKNSVFLSTVAGYLREVQSDKAASL